MSVLEFKQRPPETAKPAAISFKNVLYATDFSPTSEAALPYATAICRRFGAMLHIAHVLSETSLLMMAGGVDYMTMDKLLDEAKAGALAKVEHIRQRLGTIPGQCYTEYGKVWPNLNTIAAKNKIDLIVVGTHGRGGLGKLLLGSVAEEILRHATCPVLTVGPNVSDRRLLPEFDSDGGTLAPVELNLQRILYAAAFTSASQPAGTVALALAEETRAHLTLLHVLENYANLGSRPGPIEESVERLQAFAHDAPLADSPEIVVEFGSPWECILRTAVERCAELIVLGASPRERTTHVPWSTVHRVVAQSPCPVLTVRS